MKVINPKSMIEDYLRSQNRLLPSEQNPAQEMHKAILEGAARCLVTLDRETDYAWDLSVSEKNRRDRESAIYEAVQKIEMDSWAQDYKKEEDMRIIQEKYENLKKKEQL